MYDPETPTNLLDTAGSSQLRSFFERIMVMVPSMVVVLDLRNHRVVWCNQLARDFVGSDLVAMGEDATRTLREITHPDDRESVDQCRARVASLTDDDTENYEFRARNASGQWRWFASEDRVCGRNESGEAILSVTSAIDITETKQREEHQRLIAMELDHRVKNTLAIVQSIANRTAKSDANRRFGEDLMNRVQGLIASQDSLHLDDAPSVEMRDLIRCQLETFKELPIEQITYHGPTARLKSGVFQTMGMGFHELLRNACSHGALSGPGGKIAIEWRFVEHGETRMLEIEWCESAGPAPAADAPTDAGFGKTILKHVLPTMAGGKADLDISRDGVRWCLEAPASQVVIQ